MTEVESVSTSAIDDSSQRPWTVWQGDARNTDDFLAAASRQAGLDDSPFLTTTITSPPYANLVDYGPDRQIGFGQSVDEYLAECAAIFESLFRWTKSDGSLWVVADTLIERTGGAKLGQLLPLPFMLAEHASRAGWVLRDVIIWRKDRTRPWSGGARLRNGFEYVLMFAKSADYKHRVERLRDLRSLKTWWTKYPERHNPWGMTPDNVWDIPIPVQGSWASTELRHACPFPPELVRRIVQLSTDDGDVVFDPFSGSGVVAAVAEAESRRPLGTELNEEFVELYREHVRPAIVASGTQEFDVDTMDMTGTLLSLRVLKYPKDLARQLIRTGLGRTDVAALLVGADPFDLSPKTTNYAKVECIVCVPDSATEDEIASLRDRVSRAESRAPLSKYGLDVTTVVRRLSELVESLESSREYAWYGKGRTWKSEGDITPGDFLALAESESAAAFPPILSSIRISVEVETD